MRLIDRPEARFPAKTKNFLHGNAKKIEFLNVSGGIEIQPIAQTTYPRQRIFHSFRNFLFIFLFNGVSIVSIYGLFGLSLTLALWDYGVNYNGWGGILFWSLLGGLTSGLMTGPLFGGAAVVQHYALIFVIAYYNLLPWRLVPFLDHCVDLIFLRRVGGGYIFVHRLLMERFAERLNLD